MPAAKPKVALVCLQCGNPFEVEPYRVKRAKFCCWSCKQTAGCIARNIKSRGTGTKTLYVKLNGRHMHRVIAERKLGRPLLPGEIVHHDDRNKRNNSEGNLIVTNQPDHVREHIYEMLAARKEKAGY